MSSAVAVLWCYCGVGVPAQWLQPQRYQNGSKFWDKGGKSGPPLCTPTVPPGIPGCASVYTIHTLAHPLVHICRPSSTHLSTLAHPWIVIFYTPVQPVLTWNLTHSFAHLYSSVTPLSIYLSHAPCIVLLDLLKHNSVYFAFWRFAHKGAVLWDWSLTF